MTQPCR